MVMPNAPGSRRYTVEEVYNWPPDGNRYEVVYGELLVTPSPLTRHQAVVTRLLLLLGEYLRSINSLDALYTGPVDFFHGEDVYVQPDIVVVYPEEISRNWRTMKRWRLTVEVLSPSSTRGDRLVKRPAYQAAGVETYWIVDSGRATVEVWHPGDSAPGIQTRQLTWRFEERSPELVVDLAALFAGLPPP